MFRSPYNQAAIALGILVALGVVVEAIMIARRAPSDDFVFLRDAGDAEWIRADRPMRMGLIEAPDKLGEQTSYRVRFDLSTPVESMTLRFKALESAAVSVDDVHVFDGPPPRSWKSWREVSLNSLAAGAHTVTFDVTNPSGPAMLLAEMPEAGLASGPSWTTRNANGVWTSARPADTIRPVAASRAFPRSDRALFSVTPILLPLVACLFVWRFLARRRPSKLPEWVLTAPRPDRARWMILAGFGALAVNNFFRVPIWFGFDVVGHMEYINYIAELHALPLAPDGWKMNEAPLYYLVSAIPYSAIFRSLSVEQNILAMRVIPILCGFAQIEIAYRTMRYVFPDRDDAQILGTIVSALIPMHLYLTQFPSNQPFVGLWSALAVLMCYRRLHESSPMDWSDGVLLGVTLGLALLSKVTAVLVLPVVGIVLVYAAWRDHDFRFSLWPLARVPLLVGLTALLVCGWYYLRNLAALGTPFSVGFSEELGTVWRQDPGFRTMGQLTRFGEGLWYPVHAGFVSYWDSLYSTFWSDGQLSAGNVPDGWGFGEPRPPSVPPWRFGFLGAATLLSVFPMTLMVAGGVHAVFRPRAGLTRGHVFAVLWIVSHLAGMLYLYLMLPTVSAGKASYLLNILPCFGLLAAQGWELAGRRPFVRSIFLAGLAAWAASSYLAFFAR